MLTLTLLATAFPLAQWLPEVLTKTAAMTIWVLHAPLTINALEQQMGCVDSETLVQSVYTMRTCRSGQQYFTIFTDIAKPDELYLMLAEQKVQPSPLPQSLSGLAKVADADIEDNGQRVVSIRESFARTISTIFSAAYGSPRTNRRGDERSLSVAEFEASARANSSSQRGYRHPRC